MSREQAAFLVGGALFGLVTGLVIGFALFKPGALALPPAAPQGATRGGPIAPAPSTAGMDPGGAAVMSEVSGRIEALKGRIEAAPGDPAALIELGDLYLEIERYDQAKGFYERALRLAPHEPQALTSLGICALGLRQPATALGSFREALRHAPDYWPAAAYGVIAALESLDAAAAEQMLASLRQTNPGFERLGEFEQRVRQLASPN